MQTTPTITTAPIAGTYWQWRGHSVYYVRSGDRHPERPPLLLIHGFGASTDHWRKNISGLSKDFEVWAIDLIGFGRSAKPEIQYSGDLWRDQLHDFITNVIGRPAVLAGNSLGGYAALCVAAQRPESAAGLILINSAGPFSEPQPAPEAPPVQKAISVVAKTLFQQDWASFLLFQYARQRSTIRKTLEKVYLDQSAVTDQLVEEIYLPSCDPGAPKVFASVFRTPQGEKIDLLLSQLTSPLLMLWGEGDPWMNSADRSAKFRQHYPQLTEHFIKAGHCPHDEVPEQVNELIRGWIINQ
ncbi:alpha/beta fold hydrolase [Tychonema sp. LEGE 07199]|uniref:alpha/beta fold hydrolase n=1 Tax=unclassified Tychonema TaxID=2642144 RepID=UPI00187FB309|nr:MULTISPECIES: alpha/beta fold hydrolase [unclassified Tychonema]MBE9121383.1 alpha/beta fold hydrolase [Tychonema sp. LEGE 07199]MBE9132541.1 alpha/beta fold hydrolase [Tychonema sp. LEGE 07196]